MDKDKIVFACVCGAFLFSLGYELAYQRHLSREANLALVCQVLVEAGLLTSCGVK